MKKITFLFYLLTIGIWNVSFAQENYQRIKINNLNHDTIHALQDIGLDMTCGAVFDDKSLTIELFDHEIEELKHHNISYQVLVDDMQKFYSERAARDLPNARTQVASERAMSQQRSFSVSEVINNVGQYNDCEEINWAVPANWNLNPNSSPNSFGGCLTYDMVLQELDDMRTQYPNLISARLDASPTNQTTVEGRTVYYVRISDNPDTDEAGEPETLYQSLIHSREAASVMQLLYYMWYVLENYDTDPAIRNLVNNQAMYFIPVFNPDGFVYNQTVAPNGGGGQRKNRNTSGGCGTYDDGIDLNRNSGYYWGNGGSSTTDNCSATYAGASAFSENETQIMRDFFLDHDFELALNHHSYKNAMLHAYAGVGHITNPRPDEYSKYNHDMTLYNRYAHGPSTSISGLNSGNMNDWMLGGPNGTNPSTGVPSGGTGSGKHTLAWTPENGLYSEGAQTGGYSGFWPLPSNFLPISRRAMRMNFMAAYFSGKYAKLHDLNQNDITATSGNLSFAIENLGQKASDFTVTVTPISGLNTVGPAVTESFTAAQVLEQRTVNIPYTLTGGVQPNDKIEFKVVLTNNYASDNVLYEANIVKAYTPNVVFAANVNPSNLNGWTSTGSWTTTNDGYLGTNAYISNPNTPDGSNSNNAFYGQNQNTSLQLNSTLNLSNMETVLIQYHAKWDLERSYDYVVLEGSTNGSSWTELCGKLTKPGAPTANNSYSSTNDAGDNTTKTSSDDSRQNGITALYDGDTQDKWNMEEVVIDASNNAFLFNETTVYLRFRLRTDSSNRKDSYANADFEGFTFDNFKVVEMSIPCDDSVAPTGLSVANITATSAEASWNNIPSATYDLRYREVGTSTWTTISDISGTSQVISGLDVNTDYEVQVATRCTTTTSSFSSSENFTTLDPCVNTVSSYPYTESFENTLGLWTQGSNDDIDWTNQQDDNSGNSTPSGSTGPALASDGDWFLYTEASTNVSPPGSPNMTAYLNSPCFDLTGRENAQIAFDYHMYGSTIGTLSLEASNDYGATYTTVFTISGQQHNNHTTNWTTQTVDLSSYDGDIILLRFNGLTGSSWQGDMAFDNINFTSDAASSAPPTAVCQDITIQLDGSGNATIITAHVDGGSTDDVAITNSSIDINTFDCSNIGTPVDVTLTVEDADGQTDSCIAQVTVVDQIDPTFVNVPGNISLSCGNNNPTWTDPTATDNCDTTLTVNRTDSTGLNSGDVFPVGITVISYEVTDDSGNTATASFNVTIVADTTNPTAITQNISVQLDNSGNATITASDVNNGSSDDCAVASLSVSPNSFTCADLGANTVTLTVTDTNGNINTANATVTITQQDAPTPVNCWDNYVYNNTTCVWENQGSQPTEPATECWETATFNDTTCSWDVTGTQPTEPATECWETATFNDTTCSWDVTGTQPTEPATECWETATFNDTTCSWDVTGTQPTEPATECWETATFNDTTCSWDVTGTQPTEPATECWETATFNDTTCSWDVTGTQPTEPATECWETATFNDTTCSWDVTGTQPTEPATECWETATFNDTTCSWDVTGTQPTEPATECWETATFNDTTCSWDVTGTQPTEPATECWETATFNDTTCSWDVTGTQPTEPATECWETATFNDTTCSWDVTGTQPTEPATECWETATFNDTTCSWDVTGTQPTEPATECWETATFNDTTCSWDVTGTQPTEPATECWEIGRAHV